MNDAIISRQGQGFEALLPFILVDPDPQVVANAALKTAVLFPARHTDHLEGPRFVAHLARGREHPRRCGAILGGLMLLGDERLTPLIHDTWDCLPPESRIEAASRRSPFVFQAHVLLLIDLLEEEPDDCVRFAITGAQSQVNGPLANGQSKAQHRVAKVSNNHPGLLSIPRT